MKVKKIKAVREKVLVDYFKIKYAVFSVQNTAYAVTKHFMEHTDIENKLIILEKCYFSRKMKKIKNN